MSKFAIETQCERELLARTRILRQQLVYVQRERATANARAALLAEHLAKLLQLTLSQVHRRAEAQELGLLEEAAAVVAALETGRPLHKLFLPPKPPAEAYTSLDEPAVRAALQALGATADFDQATLRWARSQGRILPPGLPSVDLGRMQALRTEFRQLLVEHLDAFVDVVYVPSAGKLTVYQDPHLVYLSDPVGVAAHWDIWHRAPWQEIAGTSAPAVVKALETAQGPHGYATPQTWWWIRAAKALLEAANYRAGVPLRYDIYDPLVGWPEEVQAQYERTDMEAPQPDLVTHVLPRRSQTVRLALYFEAGQRSSTFIQTQIVQRLEYGHQVGCDGVYYLAPNRNVACKIRTAVRKVRTAAQAKPTTVPAGCVAVFQISHLLDRWLPVPQMLEAGSAETGSRAQPRAYFVHGEE
jgi:hypothetical protein